MEKDNTKISLSAGGNYNIFDNFIEGCQIISPDWRYLYVNDAAAGQNRSEKENLVGRNFNDVYPHIEQSELFAVLQKCMNERVAVSFENEFTFPDGHKTWFDTRVEPVPEGIFIMSIDITERKKVGDKLKEACDNLEQKVEERTKELENAYESLKESEEEFRLIFDKSTDMISLSEINEDGLPGKYIEINEVGLKRLGYTKEELLNLGPTDIIAPEKRKEMPRNAVEMEKKGFSSFEIVHVTKEGKRIPVEVNGHIINYHGQEVYLTVSRDISERKKADEKLQRSRESFRALAENSPDLIIRLDKDLRYVYINSTVTGITGKSPEYYIGKTYEEAGIPEKIATLWKESNLKAFETGEIQYHEFEFHAINSLKFIDSTVVPEFNVNGEIETLLILSRDVTERKEAEKKLKETINELERSNDELQQFAYISSHDLQEPLRTIASFTQLLERRYKGKLDNDADEFMGYIVDAAKRMKEQIEGLLEYSRVGTKEGEFKPVDMNDILNQTIQNLNVSIRDANAEITHEEFPTVNGNARQLQRVFQNLISNAIKFRKSDEQLKVHISSYKSEDGNEYIFSVQDNGIGIEKQYLERVFAIFQQLHTREEYEGTGIGLSIVKRIIDRHGGRVWIESELGVGSTFYFTIPIKMLRSE